MAAFQSQGTESASSLRLKCYPFFAHRIYSADFKMEIYLKIARLYLEETDHISAEAHINRAALLQSEVTNKELHVIYKVGICRRFVTGSYSRSCKTCKFHVDFTAGCV